MEDGELGEILREVRDEVALTREEVALTREEVRLSREQGQRAEATHSDLHDFIRQMIARMERSGRETSRALAAQTAELQRFGAEMRREMRDQREELRELRAEGRAHTNALLRLLDRFDGPEPGAAGPA